MQYRKLEVYFSEEEERFNRTLMVRSDMNLEELGVVLETALGAEFEHMFMFRDRDIAYVHDAWTGMNAEKMSETAFEGIDDDFLFIYDTGEDWIFRCHKGEIEEINSDEFAILLDGNGQGIWEDNKDTLLRYLSGELDPDTDEEDEENGVFFPWNYEIKKLSDFDKDYDLELEAGGLNEAIAFNLENYMKNKEAMMNPFSFFGDDDAADIADLDDFDDEEDVSLQEALYSMVSYQLENDDFVRDSYEMLKDRFGQEDAMYYLSLCLLEEFTDMVTLNEVSTRESFRARINSLNKDAGVA